MEWLLDTTVFLTRDHCGIGWTRELVLASRISNLLIFLAYFNIPACLVYFWTRLHRSRRTDVLRNRKMILLSFGCFIFLCGITHLCDVLVFEWAPYRLFTLIDAVTAIASVCTAISLPTLLREVIANE